MEFYYTQPSAHSNVHARLRGAIIDRSMLANWWMLTLACRVMPLGQVPAHNIYTDCWGCECPLLRNVCTVKSKYATFDYFLSVNTICSLIQYNMKQPIWYICIQFGTHDLFYDLFGVSVLWIISLCYRNKIEIPKIFGVAKTMGNTQQCSMAVKPFHSYTQAGFFGGLRRGSRSACHSRDGSHTQ